MIELREQADPDLAVRISVQDTGVGAVFNMGGAAVANYLSVLEAA